MTRRGMATRAELEELHGLVLEALTARLSDDKQAGVEPLAVARAFLADNGFRGYWDMPETTHKKLRKLYAALCDQLAKAMQLEHPSTGQLGEVRTFLASQGIDKDAAAAAGRVTTARAIQALGSLDVPFKVKH